MPGRAFIDFTSLAVLVTTRCPYACAHCYTRSSPKRTERIDLEWALPAVEALLPFVRSVALTGGEPFLEPDLVVAVLEAVAGRRPTNLVSAGAFVREPEQARETLRRFAASGLSLVNLSFDAFHEPFGGLDLVVEASALCREVGLPVIVQLSGREDAEGWAEVLRRLDAAGIDHFRSGLLPYGRAESLPSTYFDDPEALADRGCANVTFLSLDCGGILRACCGPTLETGPESAYFVADLSAGDSPKEAVEAARQRRVLAAIGTLGPRGLAAVAGCEVSKGTPPCETCMALLTNPETVAHVEEVLALEAWERRLVAGRLLAAHTFIRPYEAAFAELMQEETP